MVIGLPSINIERKICEGSIFRKMHRLPIPKISWRVKFFLELVHVDIWGPTQNFSIGARRYFLLFVSDFTRMLWAFYKNIKNLPWGIIYYQRIF